MKLSKYQNNVLTGVASGKGNMIIEAVAGSGKTTTLVEASKFIDPQSRSAFVAFNKRNAEDLKNKLPAYVTAKTIHALGYAACAAAFGQIEIDNGKYWKLATPTHLATKPALIELINLARMTRVKLTPTGLYTLEKRYAIRGVRAQGEVEFAQLCEKIISIIKASVTAAKSGYLDSTDLLWVPLFLKLNLPKYDNIFVDEVQDLNRIQSDFIGASLAKNGRVIAVGDPCQAIYAFMGANADAFNIFKETFEAKQYPLSLCYRCPDSHLDLAREFCHNIKPSGMAVEGRIDHISFSSVPHELKKEDRSKLLIARKKANAVIATRKLRDLGVEAHLSSSRLLRTAEALLKKFSPAGLYDSLPTRLAAHYNTTLETMADRMGKDPDKVAGMLAPLYDDVDLLIDLHRNANGYNELKRLIRSLSTPESNESTVVATVHGAKGSEAFWVGILDWDKMPLKMPGMTPEQKEQEENIQLIALTRSKETLCFIEGLNDDDD